MIGHWIENKDKNISVAFQRQILDKNSVLRIAAADCYQIFLNGEFIGFGPPRAAHGYAREEVFSLADTGMLTIIVASYNIQTFWLIKQQPFVRLELEDDGKVFSELEFDCYRVGDRRQKVQRYSYQRAFTEDYVMNVARSNFYAGENIFERVKLDTYLDIKILPSNVKRPLYKKIRAQKIVESGCVIVDESRKVWRDRAHTHIGKELDGYEVFEWEHSATDDASKFVYLPNENGESKYAVYDIGRVVTGFAEMEILIREKSRIYLIFDEIDWFEERKNSNRGMNISFYRNTSSNCFCWELGSGVHKLLTFEPYAIRYMKIIVFGDAEINFAGIAEYKNPDASKFVCSVKDERAQAVIDAARESFAQNAVDILMDCPSRERAGWLADSWFTSAAERLFTGANAVEKNFLENYADASCENLPSGMIPMCYPANCYDSMYIPNYAMWYILEVQKYCHATGDYAMAEKSKRNILGILKYFSEFENEFGLLENLKGWIFIEWSAANDATHICGVNYPSNMCWYACLLAISELYQMQELNEKAKKLQSEILRLGYDGKFFVDNSVRSGGKLQRTEYKTEVCQYYAFWFAVAAKEDYPWLYNELLENFGPNRQNGYRADISPPNAIFGIYMRLDLMKRDAAAEKLYKECAQYFYPMAARTATLWEHNGVPSAVEHESEDFAVSCDHGFASYAATWLVYALCGYNGKSFESSFVGIDCEFYLPEIYARVIVKNGERRITYERD